jgi:Bacteriophage HK97-gp10, putative tail-component
MTRDVRMQFQASDELLNDLKRRFPERLKEARERAVTAMGMTWADGAKRITRDDNHIDTGLYINSIGYNTGAPASEDDTIFELTHSGDETNLKIGSGVHYAPYLEKRYNIFARALDTEHDNMMRVGRVQIERTLRGD